MLLHPLPPGTDDIPSPEQFTYPFRYKPHPLCVAAVEDITPVCRQLLEKEKSGKMFGVMIVEAEGKRYYLAAFSGMTGGTYLQEGFVPPVYNLQTEGSYFKQEEANITAINQRIANGEDTPELRKERKQRSIALQQWLFEQFHLLNARGESKSLTSLFEDHPQILTAEEYFNGKRQAQAGSRIPSGAGECCAPKLLQYAYRHSLKPLCMAEFWLGPSPKDEVRIDSQYYPACNSKCKPILRHMLEGLNVEENPMLSTAREQAKKVEYIYDDEDMAVVYKPAGLPSTPGNDDMPSLLDIVRLRWAEAVNVHRLDMDTSGIIVFALNEKAYKQLQEQFVKQAVGKTYVALLERPVAESVPRKGTITLPLLPNPFDRPRQMVSYEHGKRAVTEYELQDGTRVVFHPKTGRTHQLRVHSAHGDGLGVPIKGDALYGRAADRLYLHAERIEIKHPRTGAGMIFERKADF